MIAVDSGQRWKHARTDAVVTVLRIDYPDSVRVDADGIERGITRKTLRRNYTLEESAIEPMSAEELAWSRRHESAAELTPRPESELLW